MKTEFIPKYPFAILVTVCIAMLMPHLGLLQTNIMEARNLISAREMAQDGHWIFTTINRLPRYEKPPLPTWITAVFGATFGFKNMFFLRLPAALVTLLLVTFFYRLAKQLHGVRFAFYASLVLITSFYIFFAGRDNQWDIYCHAFMIVSVFYLRNAFKNAQANMKNIMLAGLFFGCSFLSKGPVSPYALFLPFIAAYLFVYSGSVRVQGKIIAAVLLIGFAIGLSWPLYVRFFDAQHVTAAISQESERWAGYNKRPFWYYWSFVTQSGVWTIPSFVALIYPYMKTRVRDLKVYRFTLLWTLLSVVLLSVIPEKKARYLLPVLIPLALNTACYVEYLFLFFKELINKNELRITRTVFGIVAVAAIVAPVSIPLVIKDLSGQYLIWFIAGGIVSAFCGVMMIRGLVKKEFARVFYSIILFMCTVVICWLPLSKVFFRNEQFAGAGPVHSIEQNMSIRTYEANGFTPEVIWNYGSSVPEIFPGGMLRLPADSIFGLLTIPGQEVQLQEALHSYHFTLAGKIDLNSISPGRKSYNVRLVKNYFIVKKGR